MTFESRRDVPGWPTPYTAHVDSFARDRLPAPYSGRK